MPKSKRNKKVSLTQTRKKGLELKQKVIEEVRENVDRYARIFTFSVQNMRNAKLKDVRQEWTHSRLFFGKNKVMAVALGRNAEEEYRENLHKLTGKLRGETGLLFTNSTKEEVQKYFGGFKEGDFARSGNLAQQTVHLEEGPLRAFSHSIEPHLRKLGLPTALKKGIVTLTSDHKVCQRGAKLTPEQCQILKLFGHEMANFQISIESIWNNNGTFEEFDVKPHAVIFSSSVKLQPRKPVEGQEDMDTKDLGFEAVAADDAEEVSALGGASAGSDMEDEDGAGDSDDGGD